MGYLIGKAVLHDLSQPYFGKEHGSFFISFLTISGKFLDQAYFKIDQLLE